MPAAQYVRLGLPGCRYSSSNANEVKRRVRQFSVTVNPVNDPPTLDQPGTITINEDAPLQTVILTGISSGATNEFDTLTVTNVFSNNHGVIPDPTVNYTDPSPWADEVPQLRLHATWRRGLQVDERLRVLMGWHVRKLLLES